MNRSANAVETRSDRGDPIIECTVPEDLEVGTYQIYVSLNNGTDWTSWDEGDVVRLLQIFEPPQLEEIEPSCAPIGTTSVVTL